MNIYILCWWRKQIKYVYIGILSGFFKFLASGEKDLALLNDYFVYNILRV